MKVALRLAFVAMVLACTAPGGKGSSTVNDGTDAVDGTAVPDVDYRRQHERKDR